MYTQFKPVLTSVFTITIALNENQSINVAKNHEIYVQTTI